MLSDLLQVYTVQAKEIGELYAINCAQAVKLENAGY
jgi:hypothetical protein